MILRLIEKSLMAKFMQFNKLILLLGARQTGKTTLLKNIQINYSKPAKNTLYLNCDLAEDRKLIDTDSLTLFKNRLYKINGLFIDEAQRLTNPGLTLKIIHDNFPKIKVFATGSSSFELKNKLSDAMTGRYLDFQLYPLSLSEIIRDNLEPDYLLEDLLRFGSYPEVWLTKKVPDKILLLQKITDSYLFNDILTFQKIRNSDVIKNLTKALAYQLGNEVNENELANRLKIDHKTVGSYLDILEQAFVIIRLKPFSQNPRREIGRNYKIYFMDLGVRNALIGDFNELSLRLDAGPLWENFLILERIKKLSFQEQLKDCYFWRSYGGAEVDYLEKSKTDASLMAFEIKFSGKKLSKGAYSFQKSYHKAVELINHENYQKFII